MPKEVGSPKVLLVEGSNDKHVVIHIWNSYYGDDIPFEIIEKQGIDRLFESIYPEFSTFDRETIGILVDANDDPERRWKQLAKLLQNHIQFQVPTKPENPGTIIDSQPRVGIWMMPDNHSSGELEDFIRELIPDEDPIWPLACDYINGIPLDDRKFRPHKELRAQIHAWLAACERPRPMGTAIGRGDLDVHQPAASHLYEWLYRLFIEE